MRFCSWIGQNGSGRDETTWGALLDGALIPLTASPASPASLLAYIQEGSGRKSWSATEIKDLARHRAQTRVGARLLAPILRPAKNLFAVGQNYADHVRDPQQLERSLSVNGVEKQRSSTAHMIFSVAHIISDLSHVLTLEAGDVILTGTPSGVGASRKPPEFLRDGDVVECRVGGIGTLRNTVTATGR